MEETGGDKSKLKEERYQNCVKPPLINPKDPNELVLKVVPPVPLHTVRLGPGNDIYYGIEKNLKEDEKNILEQFEKELGLKRELYFSGTWEGNQLTIIMKPKNLDRLQNLLPTEVA